MAKVAIVYHSGFGHTRVQAEAVHRGASRVKNVDAILIPIEEYETHWEALDHADAIVMGAPTYMAGASAQFKAFLDATASRWAEQRWKDKLAAGFTNSAGYNGDKLNTLQQFNLFAAQWIDVRWQSAGCCGGTGLAAGHPRGEAGRTCPAIGRVFYGTVS